MVLEPFAIKNYPLPTNSFYIKLVCEKQIRDKIHPPGIHSCGKTTVNKHDSFDRWVFSRPFSHLFFFRNGPVIIEESPPLKVIFYYLIRILLWISSILATQNNHVPGNAFTIKLYFSSLYGINVLYNKVMLRALFVAYLHW